MDTGTGASKPGVEEAVAAATIVFVRDAMDSLSSDALVELALSGPANQFMEAWADRPSYDRLSRILTYDEAIQPLLKQTGHDPPSIYSFFVGTTLWVRQVPAAVLASALFDHMMLGVPATVDSVTQGVQANLNRLRQIGRGKEIDCRWVAGLTGFRMRAGARLDTPLGQLRPLEPPWDRLPVWSERPATVLLCGELQMRVKIVQPNDHETTGDLGAHERALHGVRLIRLALLLCNAKPGNRKPQMTVLTAGAPHLGWMAGMTESYASMYEPQSSEELSPQEREEFLLWCGRLAEHYNATIGIAVDRVLSAATELRRPTEMLIDAVTAWESMVGTEAETSFRVTAALACLLETKAGRRHALLRELQATYRVRSKVVHGESVDPSEVAKHANAAVDVAKGALRAIFSSDVWLLSLHSSTARANALLLGDPRNAT